MNHHIGSEATVDVADTSVAVDQETSFPWDAETRLTVTPERPTTFELALRVPEWCEDVSVTVAGEPVDGSPGEFLRVEREWTAGDEVVFEAAFPVRFLESHPSVRSTSGAVALQRGPIVYCLEERDSPRSLHQVRLDRDRGVSAEHDPNLLDGVTALDLDVRVPDTSSWDGHLYRQDSETDTTAATVRAVPYYGWANRDAGAMRVWLDAESR